MSNIDKLCKILRESGIEVETFIIFIALLLDDCDEQ